jgi:hypothetical protein
MPTQKLFCYVDETGQDTAGRLFVVSVVLASHDREPLRRSLGAIECASGKGQVKWHRSKRPAREAYTRSVLAVPALHGRLFYDAYPNTRNYPVKTVLTVARTVILAGGDDCKTTVFVDGLRKSQYHWFGVELRHLGIKISKVRGVHRDEADALMRLADAVCGFVRAALEGETPYAALLAAARADGTIRPLSQ